MKRQEEITPPAFSLRLHPYSPYGRGPGPHDEETGNDQRSESTPAETKIPTINTSFSILVTNGAGNTLAPGRGRCRPMPRQALRWSHPSRRRSGPGYAAEGDIVNLTRWIVALEGARVSLGFGVTGGITTHCSGKIGVREDLGDVRGWTPGHGVRPGSDLSDGIRVVVLVTSIRVV